MPGTEDFIKQFGDVPFSTIQFCDADNLTLCEAFYMQLENVVSSSFDDEPQNFSDACKKLYGYNGNKHCACGVMIPKKTSVRLMEMSNSVRYSEMKIAACVEKFDEKPALQFAAATLFLPDGTLVIPYRGTDDTFVGWIEDVDIYVKKGIPSYQLAVDYLEKAAATYEGNIIICGHSKGGNVALYAALRCSKAVRDRIIRVYNNDGPGFADYSLFRTPQYRELLPKYRHFVPHSSFVGMMLAHDDDYTVVKSNKSIGAMQHDIASWQIRNGAVVTRPELSVAGRVTDLFLMNLIERLNTEQADSVSHVLTELVSATGNKTITEFAKSAVSSIKKMSGAWKVLDDDMKENFKSAFKGAGKLLTDARTEVKTKVAPAAFKRASVVAQAVAAVD